MECQSAGKDSLDFVDKKQRLCTFKIYMLQKKPTKIDKKNKALSLLISANA
jgi:hypothetical protein